MNKTAKISLRVDPKDRAFLEGVFKKLQPRVLEHLNFDPSEANSLGSFLIMCAKRTASVIEAVKFPESNYLYVGQVPRDPARRVLHRRIRGR